MKLSHKIAVGIVAMTAAVIVLSVISGRSHKRRMLNKIADEGYETAQDVLYPGKNIQDKRLHFGPVLPG
ncbi:MAG: hypothetical protein ABIQ31_07210 [Ferruginibacter sp.]